MKMKVKKKRVRENFIGIKKNLIIITIIIDLMV